jgi:hypothetical protein
LVVGEFPGAKSPNQSMDLLGRQRAAVAFFRNEFDESLHKSRDYIELSRGCVSSRLPAVYLARYVCPR